MSTIVEDVVLPRVLLAAHVNEPLSLRSVVRMMRVSFATENLPEVVICLPCLSQEIDGSGIPDTGHVISRRTPGSNVTRVPIWTDIGFMSVIRSTELDAASIFGTIPSAK